MGPSSLPAPLHCPAHVHPGRRSSYEAISGNAADAPTDSTAATAAWAAGPPAGQPPAVEERDLFGRVDHLPVLLPVLRTGDRRRPRVGRRRDGRHRLDRRPLLPRPGDLSVRAQRRGRTASAEPADRLRGSARPKLSEAGLQPHRLERYMRSTDPDFETKAADVIGLYLDPPQHAVVFCIDEKTAIQALDRIDPLLPLPPGRPERHGFEHYRHGMLPLDATLNTHTASAVPRHTSDEFVAFLTSVVE